MENFSMETDPDIPANPADVWSSLRTFTAARIGLGRAGAAIPTGETLAFKLAHARARDAVHAELDLDKLSAELTAIHPLPVITLASHAKDRAEYLRRPDFGRKLSVESRAVLESRTRTDYDLALVFTDGLSALAIGKNAAPFLKHLLALLPDVRIAPLVIASQGRVAIGDEIGELLRARCVVVLIGERPGLSSPDSMGAYLTFAPRTGLTDERRNCISNIRPEGLPHAMAAAKLAWLFRESTRRQLSGVNLKDETTAEMLDSSAFIHSF